MGNCSPEAWQHLNGETSSTTHTNQYVFYSYEAWIIFHQKLSNIKMGINRAPPILTNMFSTFMKHDDFFTRSLVAFKWEQIEHHSYCILMNILYELLNERYEPETLVKIPQ